MEIWLNDIYIYSIMEIYIHTYVYVCIKYCIFSDKNMIQQAEDYELEDLIELVSNTTIVYTLKLPRIQILILLVLSNYYSTLHV